MLRLTRAVLIIAFLGLAPLVVSAQQNPNTITVSGDAEVRIVPDEVVLTVGVETFENELSVAKRLNDKAIASALEVTKKFGIPAEHVQTDYISVEPRYRNYEVTNELLGYLVRKSIVIRFKDIPKFEDLLTTLLESGVNRVHAIEFRTTELRKHRDEARVMALKAAREKAQAMASVYARKAEKAISISESGQNWWWGFGSGWGTRWSQGVAQNAVQESGAGSQSDEVLAPGQVTVRSTVAVSFLLE